MLLNCRLLKGVVSGDIEGVIEIGRETSSRRHTAQIGRTLHIMRTRSDNGPYLSTPTAVVWRWKHMPVCNNPSFQEITIHVRCIRPCDFNRQPSVTPRFATIGTCFLGPIGCSLTTYTTPRLRVSNSNARKVESTVYVLYSNPSRDGTPSRLRVFPWMRGPGKNLGMEKFP